jgi:hypothetical protein
MIILIRTLVLASFLVAFSVPVQANLLLMPGDVIEWHAK